MVRKILININLVNPKKAKHKFHQVPENRIKSQKNPQARGDTTTIDERHSDGEDKRMIDPYKRNGFKGNKHQSSNKNLHVAQSRKKTVSHYAGMNNLDVLVNKSTKLHLKAQKEALISSNDSGAPGMHKKPRQPKQRIGANSKVSSNEKESKKKSAETGK